MAEWLASGAGKSVRRAKAGALDKLAGLGLVQCEVRVGTARAVAFAPMTYEAMPKALGRLQVAGTDLPREEPGPWRPQDQTGVELVVTVDRAGHMSTGKLAAQVAHVVVGWAGLHRSFEPNPRRFVVVPVPRSALVSAAAEEDTVAVHDAGHTEVAPGTLTAVGVSCADPVSAPALPRG